MTNRPPITDTPNREIHISFKTGNDVFAYDRAAEIAATLRIIADEIQTHGISPARHRIRDVNGNTIGAYHD